MPKESMLAHLIAKEANIRAMSDPNRKDGNPIIVESALKRIKIQRSQIAPINGGDPITGKGITKQ